MRTQRALALLLLAGAASHHAPAAQPAAKQAAGGPRYALLVGVTRYRTFPSLELKGPANDVVLMRQVLKDRFGFADADVVTLSEAAGAKNPNLLPTYANIAREMADLEKKVKGKKDARVVVYLSGHGTRQPDLLRPPKEVKLDGMSEVFLPADFAGWDEKNNRLKNGVIDFELRGWLEKIRAGGARVWAVIDCCHSGTIARGLAVPRKVDERDPQLGVPREAFAEAQKRWEKVAAARKEGPARAPLDEPGLVAVYASLPTETTFEDLLPDKADPKDQKMYGVLTWYLAEVLNDVAGKGGPDITFTELVKRVQARYRNQGIDHPTPLADGQDRDEPVLWSKPGAGPRRTTLFLLKSPAGALSVSAGRLHGLVENSVLAVYPRPGAAGSAKALGHVLVTKCRPTDSDVTLWDEAKAPEFQKGRYARPKGDLQGGERCQAVFLAYGDLTLRAAAATTDAAGNPLAVEEVQAVRGLLGKLTEEAKQYVTVVEPERAQWLVRSSGEGLQLLRREGMTTGPLMVAGRDPAKLSGRLQEIARAQMLLQMDTTATPPDKESVRAQEAIDFAVDLLRQAGGRGEFRPVPVVSGEGPVFRVGDRVQLRFSNRGYLDVDVTVLQVDQNYVINQMFPYKNAVVQNRLPPPARIPGEDKGLYTGRAKVDAEGVTALKDAKGARRGTHYFVVLAVQGVGDPVDFRDLGKPGAGEKDIKRGLTRGPRSVLRALQGQPHPRAGLEQDELNTFAVRVIRWQIEAGGAEK